MTASAQSSSSTTALSSTQDSTAQQVSTAAVILISICDSLSLTWQIYAEAESNANELVRFALPRRNSIEGRLCWQDADCWLSHRDVKYRFFCSILIDSDLENHVRFTVAHNVAKNAGRLTSVLLLGYTKRPAFLRMVLCKLYFWRMKMRMGQPVKSKWLRSLFSRNLLEGK